MRLCTLLKDAQNCGRSPTSVAGGLPAFGNCDTSAGFFGPGSLRLPGAALIAPCGGSSGFPKDAAFAADAAVRAAPAAPAASSLRRESGKRVSICQSPWDRTDGHHQRSQKQIAFVDQEM